MMDRKTYFRLGKNLFAQIYGQVITIAVQLSLVPVLLYYWGQSIYGSWLILSTIPIYLTLSDFGFTFIAKNEMLIAVAAGKRNKALSTYQSIFQLLNIGCPTIVVLAALVIWRVDVIHLLSLTSMNISDIRIVLILFILNVVLYQYFMLICAGIRSENRPATEALWAANSRLGEGAAICVAAVLGFGPTGAATAMLCSRVLFLLGGGLWLRRASPWLTLGYQYAYRKELKRLVTPALAYMCMPLSQAAMIQGPVLVAGAAMGPLSVVTFATSRTLARLGTSVTNMFNNALVAEYSSLMGLGLMGRFRRLLIIHIIITLSAVILYAAGIIYLSNILMKIFTHGKIEVLHPLFEIIVAGVIAEMIWSALFTPISAINRHKIVTLAFLALSIAGIIIMLSLASVGGLNGIALVVMAVNVALVVISSLVCYKISFKQLPMAVTT